MTPVLWVIAFVAAAVVGLALLAATGRLGGMASRPPSDVPKLLLPQRRLVAADLDAVRFPVTVRGYAMDQVDALIERFARELAERDADARRAEDARDDEPRAEDDGPRAEDDVRQAGDDREPNPWLTAGQEPQQTGEGPQEPQQTAQEADRPSPDGQASSGPSSEDERR